MHENMMVRGIDCIREEKLESRLFAELDGRGCQSCLNMQLLGDVYRRRTQFYWKWKVWAVAGWAFRLRNPLRWASRFFSWGLAAIVFFFSKTGKARHYPTSVHACSRAVQASVFALQSYSSVVQYQFSCARGDAPAALVGVFANF